MIISKLARRSIILNSKFLVNSTTSITKPKYYFSKLQKITHFKKIIDDQIKQEEKNPQNITQYENKFKSAGWNISKQNTLVQLSKNIANYQVRLLSNIRSPTNFQDQHEHEKQAENEGHEEPNIDMAQIGIYVTRNGIQKTLVINTVVTSGFEITGINFEQNYDSAKKNRSSLQNCNQYIGPNIQTLPDTVFESIYGFLQETLGIDNELLNQLADYCLDREQEFYLNWLKDIRSIV